MPSEFNIVLVAHWQAYDDVNVAPTGHWHTPLASYFVCTGQTQDPSTICLVGSLQIHFRPETVELKRVELRGHWVHVYPTSGLSLAQ